MVCEGFVFEAKVNITSHRKQNSKYNETLYFVVLKEEVEGFVFEAIKGEYSTSHCNMRKQNSK